MQTAEVLYVVDPTPFGRRRLCNRSASSDCYVLQKLSVYYWQSAIILVRWALLCHCRATALQC